MFGDRFLYLRFALTLAVLAVSCLWSHREGVRRYPSFEDCLREPAGRAGTVLDLRSIPVASAAKGELVLVDSRGVRIPVRGVGEPSWEGTHLTLVARFVPPSGTLGAHVEVLRDECGRPRMRLVPGYAVRRGWMLGVSLSLVALLGYLFSREFRLVLPRGVVRVRRGTWPTS